MPDPVVTPDPNTPAETPTITLETVTAKTPDQLDDNDKQWLESNAETLDDEVADKYGIIKPITEVTPVVRGAQLPAEQGKEGDEEDPDLADMDPEDQKRISKLVQKELAKTNISGSIQKVQEAELTAEVDGFIRDQAAKIPNVGNYRKAMLTYAKHPAYAQVPVDAIFNIVAGKDLMKMGARLERQAQTKVKETQIPASSARVEPGKKDWGTASKEEFEAKKASVLGRPS